MEIEKGAKHLILPGWFFKFENMEKEDFRVVKNVNRSVKPARAVHVKS